MRWWEMIAQRFRAPDLMERMFRRFDVDERIARREDGPKVLQNAAARCVTCSGIEACAEWLDQPEPADTPPSYCRNASLIMRLRSEGETLH